MFVFCCVMDTRTPGITAPELSETTPEILPESTWANIEPAVRNNKTPKRMRHLWRV